VRGDVGHDGSRQQEGKADGNALQMWVGLSPANQRSCGSDFSRDALGANEGSKSIATEVAPTGERATVGYSWYAP
jgi:hypothetical protein